MNKYEKRKIVVSAMVFSKYHLEEIIKFIGDKFDSVEILDKEVNQYFSLDNFDINEIKNNTIRIKIINNNNILIANDGDYIVKSIHHEVYPCNSSVFIKIYDEVYDDDELKYMKKPIVVDAVQFNRNNLNEVISFIGNYPYAFLSKNNELLDSMPDNSDYIVLIHFKDKAFKFKEGDFIIEGVENDFYPCEESVFNLLYKKV